MTVKQTNRAEQIRFISAETMDKLAELQLVPSPINYELIYTFITGEVPELNRELDQFIQTDTLIDDEQASILHEKYCKLQSVTDEIEAASTDLMVEMGKIQSVLELAGQDTNAYGNALEGANSAISKQSGDAVNLSKIVEKIIVATKAMEKKTRAMELDLESSSFEINKLRESLVDSQREALTDGLTRLANRKHFDKKLQEAVRDVYDNGTDLSILISDVDFFKKFNDSWGHVAGDQILRLIGKCMMENVKGKDTAARYGGEEFAIILPQTGLEGALSVAEHIRKSVESKKIIKKSTGKSLGRVTMSFGVAQYKEGEQITDLVTRADTALYASKKAGRNLVMGEHEIPDFEEKDINIA